MAYGHIAYSMVNGEHLQTRPYDLGDTLEPYILGGGGGGRGGGGTVKTIMPCLDWDWHLSFQLL